MSGYLFGIWTLVIIQLLDYYTGTPTPFISVSSGLIVSGAIFAVRRIAKTV